MPLPEGYLPREGDVLVLHVATRFNVRDDDPGERLYVHVCPVGVASYHNFRVPLKDVVGLHCRHWDEGDKVQLKHQEPTKRRPGEVVAVHGDRAWVKFTEPVQELVTVHANQIEERPDPVVNAIAEGRAPTMEEVAAVLEPPEPPEFSPAVKIPKEEPL